MDNNIKNKTEVKSQEAKKPEVKAKVKASEADKASKKPDDKFITISLPNTLSGEEEERLRAIVESKQSLLTKALETKELPILVTEDTVSFPWFTNHEIEGEAIAYAQLISAMIEMAKKQKRVIAKDKPEENEKFAMRIFTVRLGLIGEEYKLIRKLLSHNLTGNSAWRNGQPEKAKEPKSKADPKPKTEKKAKVNPPSALLADNPKKTAEKANKPANTGKKQATKTKGEEKVDGASNKKEAKNA